MEIAVDLSFKYSFPHNDRKKGRNVIREPISVKSRHLLPDFNISLVSSIKMSRTIGHLVIGRLSNLLRCIIRGNSNKLYRVAAEPRCSSQASLRFIDILGEC